MQLYIALYKHQEEHHFILKYLIIEKLFFHYFVSLWHLNCSFIFKCTFISPIHAIKKHDNILCKCTSFFVIFFYRFLSLSMPNYISVIFLADVFACRHAHFVVEEKRTVSYPYLATSPRTRGRPLHRTLFLTGLYLARLKFCRKPSPP